MPGSRKQIDEIQQLISWTPVGLSRRTSTMDPVPDYAGGSLHFPYAHRFDKREPGERIRHLSPTIATRRNLLSDIWTDTRVLIRANINGDSALQGQEIEWE